MMKILSLALCLAVGLVQVPAALAEQECDPSILNYWKGADGNATTRGSHQDMAQKCFSAIDSDDDAVISGEEWNAYHNSLFDSMDLDGDDTAAQDEVQRTLSWE